jgi:hypothetical protein
MKLPIMTGLAVFALVGCTGDSSSQEAEEQGGDVPRE